MGKPLLLVSFIVLILLPLFLKAENLKTLQYQFGPFDSTYYEKFEVVSPATISNGALQVTPDSAGNFTLVNRSGRVLFKQSFKLWQGDLGSNPNASLGSNGIKVASFNSSFFINIFRLNGSLNTGEGLAFIIAPDLNLPPGSDGEYLGLTNSTTDGNSSNHLVAIEFDTYKQDFDPDDNHIGLDINGVRSNKTEPLSDSGFQLAPNGTKFFHVWVQYDGSKKSLEVYMEDEDDKKPSKPMPSQPIMTANLDISTIVNQNSYFGFSASTGSQVELNCVLEWNLTVEKLPEEDNAPRELVIALAVGVPFVVILLVGSSIWYFLVYRKRREANDPNILGTLKSLPGVPREFRFKDLKKATNNFDDKHTLGQGGFGVVYRGFLAKENLEVAVKKFSRDDIKGKDDFLAELTIINRLRHKHLVKLLGWCHTNGVLLLVYEYMPNGSLDTHIFRGPDQQTLTWSLRFKILTGVASALHYLHDEYDQKVLHRDLKASNILLDSNFNARLGDFGLARAIDNEKTSYAELDGMPGTAGYIAPECLHTCRATRESDVYGLGAVLLEVVSGLRPSSKVESFRSLVDWIWSLHRDGRILEAVDGRLGENYVEEEAERVLLLGLACSHPMAAERPKTHAIEQILAGTVAPPYVPPFKPSFIWPAMSPLSLDGDTTAETMPMTSSQFGSGWTPKPVSGESGYSMDNAIV